MAAMITFYDNFAGATFLVFVYIQSQFNARIAFIALTGYGAVGMGRPHEHIGDQADEDDGRQSVKRGR